MNTQIIIIICKIYNCSIMTEKLDADHRCMASIQQSKTKPNVMLYHTAIKHWTTYVSPQHIITCLQFCRGYTTKKIKPESHF